MLVILTTCLTCILTGQVKTETEALTIVIEKRCPRFKSKGGVSGAVRKRKYAKVYAERILVEAKRRSLDPLAMVSIAVIESNFQYWVTSKDGNGSVGVWQLTPKFLVKPIARKRLWGCKPGPKISRHWLRWWKWKVKTKNVLKCEDQSVWDRRVKFGLWSTRELRDPYIGTFVFGVELSNQLAFCKKNHRCNKYHRNVRYLGGYGCKLPMKIRKRLSRYAHFNSGPFRVTRFYPWKLCKVYTKVWADYKKAKGVKS